MTGGGRGLGDPEIRTSGSSARGYRWCISNGLVLLAQSPRRFPDRESAWSDALAFRSLARSAGYEVSRVGVCWTWVAWHDGVARAAGPMGFFAESDARAAAHAMRDDLAGRLLAPADPVSC